MAIKFGAPSMAALAGTVGDIRQQYSKAAQEENDRKLWGFIQEKAQFDRAKELHELTKQQAARELEKFEMEKLQRKAIEDFTAKRFAGELQTKARDDLFAMPADQMTQPIQGPPIAVQQNVGGVPFTPAQVGPGGSVPELPKDLKTTGAQWFSGQGMQKTPARPTVQAPMFSSFTPKGPSALADRLGMDTKDAQSMFKNMGASAADIYRLLVSPEKEAMQADENWEKEGIRSNEQAIQREDALIRAEGRDEARAKRDRISGAYWAELDRKQRLEDQKDLRRFEKDLEPKFTEKFEPMPDGTYRKVRTYADGRAYFMDDGQPPSKTGPGSVGGTGKGVGYAAGTRGPIEDPPPPRTPGVEIGGQQGTGKKAEQSKEPLSKIVAKKLEAKVPQPKGTYGEFSRQEVATQDQAKQTILTLALQGDPQNQTGPRAAMFKKIIELQKDMIEQNAAQSGMMVTKTQVDRAATLKAWEVINNHSVVREYPVWGPQNDLTFDEMKMVVSSKINEVQNPASREYFTGIFSETLSRIAAETKRNNKLGKGKSESEVNELMNNLTSGSRNMGGMRE